MGALISYLQDPDCTLYHGDALDVLRELPDESVHCIATSPPFYALRDYGTGRWEGGDEGCEHEPALNADRSDRIARNEVRDDEEGTYAHPSSWSGGGRKALTSGPTCGKCGAHRIDQQIGLESSPDEWAAALVAVFREARRVLRKDGTLFIEVGDSYASQNASAYGNADTAPQDFPAHDSSSYRLCGECRDELLTLRSAHSDDRRVPTQDDGSLDPTQGHTESPSDRPPTSDSESQTRIRQSSSSTQDRQPAGGRTAEPSRGAQASTTLAVAFVHQVESCDVCGDALGEPAKPLGSSAPDAQDFAGSSGDSVGTSPTRLSSADHNRGTESSSGAYHSLPTASLKPKDLLGTPWLLAFALRADGWWLRGCNIWAKPNAMPESAKDRCTTAHSYVFQLSKSARYYFDQEAVLERYINAERQATRSDPEPYGRGQASVGGRPASGLRARGPDGRRKTTVQGADGSIQHRDGERWPNGGKHPRSVWTIPTQGYPEAHFATWPEALARRIILAGCPESVCSVCNAPWVRKIEPGHSFLTGKGWHDHSDDTAQGQRQVKKGQKAWDSYVPAKTLGFRPTCNCMASGVQRRVGESTRTVDGDDLAGPGRERSLRQRSESGATHRPSENLVVPGTILDPFVGSGTTCFVARKLGRRSIGIDLNPEYLKLAAKRLQQQSLFA